MKRADAAWTFSGIAIVLLLSCGCSQNQSATPTTNPNVTTPVSAQAAINDPSTPAIMRQRLQVMNGMQPTAAAASNSAGLPSQLANK